MKNRGFTLIELMITIVVISVLAAIAYPAYTGYISKARRTDASGALLDLAGRMERYYADQNSYANAVSDGLLGSGTSEHGYYNLSFQTVSASVYTLQAAPTGKQAGDDCGTLTLTSTGIKGLSGAASGMTVAKCW